MAMVEEGDRPHRRTVEGLNIEAKLTMRKAYGFRTFRVTEIALVDPLVNQVCRVNLNCQCQRGPDVFPFTGRKDSAEGTLSVSDALRSFSIRSMVAAKQTDESKKLLDDIVTHHKSKFINTRFLF
jgi:hypothetical protein